MKFFRKLFGMKEKSQVNETSPTQKSKLKDTKSKNVKTKNIKVIGEIDRCPSCKNKLKKIPSRKKKCENCGEYIFVRTRPSDRKKVLVNEKQAKKIDSEWTHTISLSKWVNTLSEYGITKIQIEQKRKDISKKFKTEVSYNDVIWSFFNELIIKYLNDLQELRLLYYRMALFLDEEGKDPFKMLYQSSKHELLRFKKAGVKKVKILTAKNGKYPSCSECRKKDNQIYQIEQALKEMPIPCRTCTHHINNEKYGFCRCWWGPSLIN